MAYGVMEVAGYGIWAEKSSSANGRRYTELGDGGMPKSMIQTLRRVVQNEAGS
jgi:hypothetical protein